MRAALGLLIAAVAIAPSALCRAARAQFVENVTPIHVLEGEATGDQFGWLVDIVGDLNGDGTNEFVVSAPSAVGGFGRLYIYDARSGSLVRHHTGSTGWSLGLAVDGAGDFDDDGVPDVIGGAPGAISGRGAARVYSGADGSIVQTWTGTAAGDAFGTAVARAGDVDDDGVDDVLVSAPNDDSAGPNFGRVTVFSGATRQAIWTFDGEASNDSFGSSVGGDVDFDGDGHADILIGANAAGPTNRGRVYVYSGATGSLLFPPIDSPGDGLNLGQFWLESPGDVDGDGTPDLYAADISAAGSRGRAYVFSGVDGSTLLGVDGIAPGEQFGIGRGAGDLDGDGRADLFLAAWLSNSGAAGAGRAIAVSSDGTVLETFTHTIPGATLGFDAIGLESDADGDGLLDHVISSEQNTRAGKVYVLPGSIGVRAAPAGNPGTLAVLAALLALAGSLLATRRLR